MLAWELGLEPRSSFSENEVATVRRFPNMARKVRFERTLTLFKAKGSAN